MLPLGEGNRVDFASHDDRYVAMAIWSDEYKKWYAVARVALLAPLHMTMGDTC